MNGVAVWTPFEFRCHELSGRKLEHSVARLLNYTTNTNQLNMNVC